MDKGKYYANRGVARNKTPLKNIVYLVEVSQLKDTTDKSQYEQYKFKDLGYLVLFWCYDTKYERENIKWHGFVTPDDLKKRIGNTQWSKFCQGKREFVIQRRIDGNNIPLIKNDEN